MTAEKQTHARRRLLPWIGLAAVGIAAALLVISATKDSASARPAQAATDAELGQRIYREGILPSGELVRATVQGDVAVEGSQLNCASCHRRSGFGASEEAAYVPPITAPALYQARQEQRGDLFRQLFQEVQPNTTRARVRDPRVRPAYTDSTLAAAIRTGTDPTGRVLDPMMPRYALSDEDMGHLIAYLKTLWATPSPGVTDSTLHFATVVTEGVDPGEREAMHAVLDAYVKRKNTDTRRLMQRPGFSPLYKDDFTEAYRTWVLHRWDLNGPAQTWPDQLDAYYRKQPVFALLSGIGAGTWKPIHDFCEQNEVPCLFPHTDLPVVSPPGAYTLYFSRGLTLEAEALARYLYITLDEADPTPIIQVYRDDEQGRVPAQALRQRLADYGVTHLEDRLLEASAHRMPAFWDRLRQHEKPPILVLWLGADDLETLAAALTAPDGFRHVYLSHTLLRGMALSKLHNLADAVYLTYPFALPWQEIPRAYRVRAWMRSRRIERTHEPIQFNTYFALSATDHALVHLVDHFSRDYLVEILEHETENALNPGVFPHLSLGPGQRFASKGSYIVQLSEAAPGGLEAASDWIIP